MAFLFFDANIVIIMAATPLDITLGIATPATPSFKTKIPIAFPTTFIIFMRMLTFIDVLESPILLYMAAPELYIANIGKLIAVIIKYFLQASNTSLSIFPNKRFMIGCANKIANIDMITETTNAISSSCAAAMQASSFFFAPIN